MIRILNRLRPGCEEILKRKNSWALNKEELEISNELENIIASKESENELTIYSMLRSEISLIENSSSVAVTLKRSRYYNKRPSSAVSLKTKNFNI
jgi:hypothetical protein